MNSKTPFFTLNPVIIMGLLLLSVTGCDKDDSEKFLVFRNLPFTSNYEEPSISSTSTAVLNGSYEKFNKWLRYRVDWNLAEGDTITSVHFHRSSAAKEEVELSIPQFPTTTSGTYKANIALTPDQEKDLYSGKLYLHIHTTSNPQGEMRVILAP